jgi:hypothetical protein
MNHLVLTSIQASSYAAHTEAAKVTNRNATGMSPTPKPQMSHTGAIAGGVVGGVIGLALISVGVYLWWKHSHRYSTVRPSEDFQEHKSELTADQAFHRPELDANPIEKPLAELDGRGK